MFWFIVMLGVNFAISWFNAYSVGKYWSESKEIGGSVRVSAVAGYAMAIIGFTMVYGCILLLIFPYIAPLIPAFKDYDVMSDVMQLASDLLFLLIGTAILPLGLLICLHSALKAWKTRSFASGATFAWNTYAQVRNTITYAREAPNAFGRVVKVLFKGKKKGKEAIVIVAILIIILALAGGYFTASAILKKSDREFDGLPEPSNN
jgi:hypothetical protein